MVSYKIRTAANNLSVLTDGRVFIPFDRMDKNVKSSIYNYEGKVVKAVTYAFELYKGDSFIGALYLDDRDDSLEVGRTVYRPSMTPCNTASEDDCIIDGCITHICAGNNA